MKRIAFFVLLTATFLVTACRTTSASPTAAFAGPATQAPAAAARPVEVIWYVRSQDVEQSWEQTHVIPTFEKAHPNIKINLVIVPWADFDTKMQTMIAAGTPPDVWSHWGPSGFADYVKRGLVADLTPYIKKDKIDLSDFIPERLNIYRLDNKYYGLPFSVVGSNIFYNKNLFDKYGVPYPTANWDDTSWTYDKFLDMCKALTHVTGNLATDVYGCSMDLWPNDAYAWMFGKDLYPGGTYETGFANTAYLDDPLVIKAFQDRQDIVWKLHYMADPVTIDGFGGDLYKSQRVAMEVTGGWGWYMYSDIKDFHWAVGALPYSGPGRLGVTFTDPWMMSSKTSHPNEAWEFFKFLISREAMASLTRVTHNPSARKSLLEDWYKGFPEMTPQQVKAAFDGSLKYGKESPNHLLVRFDQLDQVISAALDPVFNNKASAADTLPAVNKRLIDTLKQIQVENTK